MEGRVTGDVTPNTNPQEVHDEVVMQDSVERISEWVDAIARADGAAMLPAPLIPRGARAPEEVADLPPLRQVGERTRRRGQVQVPPQSSGMNQRAIPPQLGRATIPIVETEESELLSPTLNAAQRTLQDQARNAVIVAPPPGEQEVGQSVHTPVVPMPGSILPGGAIGSQQAEEARLSVQRLVEADRGHPEVNLLAPERVSLPETPGSGVENRTGPSPLRLTPAGTPGLPITPEPSSEFFSLAARAYESYKEFQISRAKAYRHLNMPPPDIVVHPPGGAVIRANYFVKLRVPGCASCNGRHVSMSHREYVMKFSMLPFLCWHRRPVTWMILDDAPSLALIALPSELVRVPPGPGSQSTGGSVTVDRLNRDVRKINAKARAAIQLFERLEAEGALWSLVYYPELQQQQARRMRALLEAEVEECREDLRMRADSLAGDLAQSELGSIDSPIYQNTSDNPPASGPELSWQNDDFFGPQVHPDQARSIISASENILHNDDTSSTFSARRGGHVASLPPIPMLRQEGGAEVIGDEGGDVPPAHQPGGAGIPQDRGTLQQAEVQGDGNNDNLGNIVIGMDAGVQTSLTRDQAIQPSVPAPQQEADMAARSRRREGVRADAASEAARVMYAAQLNALR